MVNKIKVEIARASRNEQPCEYKSFFPPAVINAIKVTWKSKIRGIIWFRLRCRSNAVKSCDNADKCFLHEKSLVPPQAEVDSNVLCFISISIYFIPICPLQNMSNELGERVWKIIRQKITRICTMYYQNKRSYGS